MLYQPKIFINLSDSGLFDLFGEKSFQIGVALSTGHNMSKNGSVQ
jgi:hypothetical protein